MKNLKAKHLILVLFFVVGACTENTNSQNHQNNRQDSDKQQQVMVDSSLLHFSPVVLDKIPQDTTITIKDRQYDVKVDIIRPVKCDTAQGTIVILHGWNLPASDWCNKTSLCQKALDQGYLLILPHMGKSTYQYEFYPETRRDWLLFPTRRWLQDTAISHIRNQFNVLQNDQHNYILGLSTGARGVALIVLDMPETFLASAALSGDCDQSLMPTEAIYRGFYGSFTEFPERWTGRDNIISRIKEFKTPIYLGHGALDRVSPHEQTVLFYEKLKACQPEVPAILHIDSTAKHDYQYWDSEVDAMLLFFKEHTPEYLRTKQTNAQDTPE